MESCDKCNERPVKIKKWGLCSKCYYTLYRKGLLPIRTKLTKEARRKNMTERLTKKYGASFIVDMDLLLTKPFWNLTDVGKKYKITRERVRQLYNTLYDDPWREVRRLKTLAVREETAAIDATCNPIRRVVDNPDNPVGVGGVGEWSVMAEAEKHNLDVRPSKTRDFDIYISGLPIEVKYSETVFIPNSITHRGFCRFGTRNDKSKSVFTVFYLEPVRDFYIVPSSKILGESTYIRIDGKDRKFSEYRDRWDLLEPPSFVDLCACHSA